MQISSEAHKKKKKKGEVTEKNKHASIRKMEKFIKRTLQSLAGGAREGTRRGRGAQAAGPPGCSDSGSGRGKLARPPCPLT